LADKASLQKNTVLHPPSRLVLLDIAASFDFHPAYRSPICQGTSSITLIKLILFEIDSFSQTAKA